MQKNGKEPLKLVPLCRTRWLVLYQASLRISENWLDLFIFFSSVAIESQESQAKQLHELFSDNELKENTAFVVRVLQPVSRYKFNINVVVD